jgi:uncharacterized protein UPF0167
MRRICPLTATKIAQTGRAGCRLSPPLHEIERGSCRVAQRYYSSVASDVRCLCCGEQRGFVYAGPVYATHELRGSLCPWCIADGRPTRSSMQRSQRSTALAGQIALNPRSWKKLRSAPLDFMVGSRSAGWLTAPEWTRGRRVRSRGRRHGGSRMGDVCRLAESRAWPDRVHRPMLCTAVGSAATPTPELGEHAAHLLRCADRCDAMLSSSYPTTCRG